MSLRSTQGRRNRQTRPQVSAGPPSSFDDESTGVVVVNAADEAGLSMETPATSQPTLPLDLSLEVSSEISVHSSVEEEEEQRLLLHQEGSSSGEDLGEVGDDVILLFNAGPAPGPANAANPVGDIQLIPSLAHVEPASGSQVHLDGNLYVDLAQVQLPMVAAQVPPALKRVARGLPPAILVANAAPALPATSSVPFITTQSHRLHQPSQSDHLLWS